MAINWTDWRASLEAIQRMKWSPKFWRSYDKPDAPGGGTDMWWLVDDDSGETLVAVSVPKGRSDIIGYIAANCSGRMRMVFPDKAQRQAADATFDPQGVMETESRAIADALYAAYVAHLHDNGKQPNAWTLNEAMQMLWFAWCGQVPDELRALLLYRFNRTATADAHMPTPPTMESTDVHS